VPGPLPEVEMGGKPRPGVAGASAILACRLRQKTEGRSGSPLAGEVELEPARLARRRVTALRLLDSPRAAVYNLPLCPSPCRPR
jgi:hypothetical protein